jgi:NDP-sugar pyrophosphorylase family protein
MPDDYSVNLYIKAWASSIFGRYDIPPWDIVQQLEAIIKRSFRALDVEYRMEGDFAIHQSSTIEEGAILKGTGFIGARCFVAAGAYLRGGVHIADDCIVGPGSELKSSVVFSGSKLAHFNFVGNSIVGSDVNLEAGAILANFRNELAEKTIRIACAGRVIDTGVTQFGSLIGDSVRIGANAVVAPGALIAPGTVVGRLELVDQNPE